MRAMLFPVGAVALTLLSGTAPPAPGPTSPTGPLPLHQPTGKTRFLAPGPVFTALGLEAPGALSGDASPQNRAAQHHEGPREFYFSRVAYSGWGRGFRGRGSWATDYPTADRIFLSFIDRLLSNLDAYESEHVVRLDDPDVRRFPFLYALEVGYMALTPEEVEGLRDYLHAGGFLVIDDFWGSRQWANFEYEIMQVLPGATIVDLPLDHPLFTTFYEIDELMQVPNIRNGINGYQTFEEDGYVPMTKGIHDENGRLMVVINWNTDLGDAWEHADNPYYPLKYSTYAYEMGVNMIVYAMSH